MNFVEEIKRHHAWEEFAKRGWMNQHLEFGAKLAMGQSAGVFSKDDLEKLQNFWQKEIVEKTEVRPGLFKRFPKEYPYQRKYSLSHDELLGLALCSMVLEPYTRLTIKRILDQGPNVLGLYMSGHSPFKPRAVTGNWFMRQAIRLTNWLGPMIDSEWFILRRPLYRGLCKIAANRQITPAEYEGIKFNLLTEKAWNLLDLRCLLLELADRPEFRQHVVSARKRMGESYKGRYGKNPLYLFLWEKRGKSY